MVLMPSLAMIGRAFDFSALKPHLYSLVKTWKAFPEQRVQELCCRDVNLFLVWLSKRFDPLTSMAIPGTLFSLSVTLATCCL